MTIHENRKVIKSHDISLSVLGIFMLIEILVLILEILGILPVDFASNKNLTVLVFMSIDIFSLTCILLKNMKLKADFNEFFHEKIV